MSYFEFFPDTQYRFGDEATPDTFENIAIYADVVDQIKDNIAFYYDYTIEEFERADQLSTKLYGTPIYHWTFYLLNDHIRERGWPLNNREVFTYIEKNYPDITITTRDNLADKFRVGQTVTGNTSGATGLIVRRRIDMGQMILKNVSGTFIAGETLSSLTIEDRPLKPLNTVETLQIVSTSEEYLSARHYVNGDNERVTIDPTVGPGALLTEITYLDYLLEQNDELKQIRVIKPSSINRVVNAFSEAVRS